MSVPQSADQAGPSQRFDVLAPDTTISENASSSATEQYSRRGSRTGNACEQCQRRKTKCTGQPSPCEACEKIGLSCHFDSKTNWKTRTRATYSAEDGKLQYMLNAILSALKYSDEKVLDGLMTALRQNEPPEVIAMHLRSNIDTLREHGHISNMTIDQADLISLAIRISGADTSNAIPQDGDPDFETPHYQTTTMDINFSNSEGNTQMTSGEHTQQADMGNHMRHHSSMDPEWNPAFSIIPNSGQSSSSPWNQTQFVPMEFSHQGYYDNQWINFTQGPNVMPPGDMGQLYYASSHNTVQSDSEPNSSTCSSSILQCNPQLQASTRPGST